MRLQTLTLSLLAAAFISAAAAPAFADWGDWRRREAWEHRRHEWAERRWREHEWREHEWRERRAWHPPSPYAATPWGWQARPGY